MSGGAGIRALHDSDGKRLNWDGQALSLRDPAGNLYPTHGSYFMKVNDDNECEEVCGDGVFLGIGSECDDHNTDSGDGCSNVCTIEYGFDCGTDGTTCGEIIPPYLFVATVEKPNVVILEFDEEVFISSDGKILTSMTFRCANKIEPKG